LSLANVDRSCTAQLRADFAGRYKDRIVQMFGELHHTILFGKLPDVPQNINHPVGFHFWFPWSEWDSWTEGYH
jgi:hypothetical protein